MKKGLIQHAFKKPKLGFQVPIPSLFLTHNEQFQKIFFISPKFLQYLMIFSSSSAHLALSALKKIKYQRMQIANTAINLDKK